MNRLDFTAAGPVKMACIYSLPRSGSTVLQAELDRYRGIACVPECHLPQVLEFLSEDDFSDAQRMAALFFASSPAGSVLSFQEAVACIHSGNRDPKSILTALGLAHAKKTRRDPALVRAIVWKTTRLMGRWQLFADAGGCFLILRRNPVNLFEYQVGLEAGLQNRNPFRFAVFRESCESAFSRLPHESTRVIDFESIQQQLPGVLSWLGVSGELWPSGSSVLPPNTAGGHWRDGLMEVWNRREDRKKRSISALQLLSLRGSQALSRFLRPALGLVRDHYDLRLTAQLLANSEKILAKKRV